MKKQSSRYLKSQKIRKMRKSKSTLPSRKIEKLYDDWIDKRISEKNFQRILEKAQEEQDLLRNQIEEMEKRVVANEVDEINTHKWIQLIK